MKLVTMSTRIFTEIEDPKTTCKEGCWMGKTGSIGGEGGPICGGPYTGRVLSWDCDEQILGWHWQCQWTDEAPAGRSPT